MRNATALSAPTEGVHPHRNTLRHNPHYRSATCHNRSSMMPGGHLATALALSGTVYATTGSVEVAAGCFAGGFLIDVDHYLDYLVFEKQWQRPSPLRFLEYYFNYSRQRLVLALHPFEAMALRFVTILVSPIPLVVGYWFGAAMHLTFDMLVNGEYALRRAVLFYLFAYRASQ